MQKACLISYSYAHIYLSGNDAELSAFWQAAKHLHADSFSAENVIQLTADVFILGKKRNGSTLFVRADYVGLEKEILKQFALRPSAPAIGVIGKPGIGKTFFSYYLLMKAAREGKAVVYESREFEGDQPQWCIFSGDIACEVPVNHRYGKELLGEDNTLYLVDSRAPKLVDAPTVLVTSPRLEVYDDFCRKRSSNGEPLYMPMWSWEELLKLREKCFPLADVEKMKAVYARWGGIAREVLYYTKQNIDRKGKTNDPLSAAITWAAIDKIITAKCFGAEGRAVSHRLFHAVSSSCTYQLEGYEVASDYVNEELMKHLADVNERKLKDFAAFSGGEPILGALRGHAFEYLAHKQLQAGGTFDIKQLGAGKSVISALVLPKSTLMKLDRSPTASDANGSDRYLKPTSRNFAAVDSVLCTTAAGSAPRAFLFQMHSGEAAHPVKHKPLSDLMSSLGGVEVVGLVFVVPKDRFAAYVHQNYVDERKHVVDRPSAPVKSLKQFALCCDVGNGVRGVKRKNT